MTQESLDKGSYLTESSNIYLKAKKAGGMKITFQSPPKNLDEKMLYNILRDYKMLNCEVLVRDENGGSILPLPSPQGLIFSCSDRRRLYRCDHEGPPEVHQMVSYPPPDFGVNVEQLQPIRLQQDRLSLIRLPGQIGSRAAHGRHELRARPGDPRCRR